LANPADLSDARQLFAKELGVGANTAYRIADFLQKHYEFQTIPASRADLLRAASWAAHRLRQRISAARLETVDSEEIAASLADGCPLCG
jgi:hypothetical protein